MFSVWPYTLGPVIGAAIGWATNWVAVRMLFRPRREKRFLGLRFQGLIPKRRAELTQRVAEIVEEELIGREEMRAALQSANVSEPILEHAEKRVGRFLHKQVGRLPGFVRTLVRDDMIEGAKKAIVREIARTLPQLSDEIVAAINSRVDLKRLVIEKLDSIEMESIEELVYRLSRRELRSIILAGAVLGALIGALQSLCLWLLS